MSERPEITQRLAGRLKEERASKGLSLDALSKLSGVSRSMLSQIERGESSPTVASLWQLTKALNVDFGTLLDADDHQARAIREHLTADQVPVIDDRTVGCAFRILSGPEDVGQTEVYDIALHAGARLESEAHRVGCVEHLTVLDGEVEVWSDGETVQARTGDTVRYRADVAHAIRAADHARVLLVVKNP
ncbi:MAG: XRE family transcriptional regulator [Pseudomonadota bacterium]